MANSVTCPSCGANLRLPETIGSSRIKCPKCGGAFAPQLGSAAAGAAWFFARNKQKHGPYTLTQLQAMAKTGQLQQSDLVVQAGGAQWLRANAVKGLFARSQPNGAGHAASSKAAVKPKAVRARTAPEPEEEDVPKKGGALPWIITIMLLLIVAGAAGFAILGLTGTYDPLGMSGNTNPASTQPVAQGIPPSTQLVAQVSPPSTHPEVPNNPATNPDKADDLLLKPFNTAMDKQDAPAAEDALKEAEAKAKDDPTATEKLHKAREKLAALKNTLKVQVALANFYKALGEGKLDDAKQALDDAVKAAPDDPQVMQARLKLQEALNKTGTDEAARKKRMEDYQAWLAKGKDAMDKRSFDDAVKAFNKAHILNQNDPTLLVLLQQAWVAKGKDAMDSSFDDAAKAFNEARLLNQNDATLLDLVQQAEKARDAAHSGDTVAEMQKAVAEIRRLIQANDLAAAQKVQDAIVPSMMTHPDVVQVRQELADAQKKMQAGTGVQKLVADARLAMTTSDLDGAQKKLDEALRLAPDNADVLKARQELADAQKKMQAGKDVQKLVADGRLAMTTNDLEGAQKKLTEAQGIAPDNADVLKFREDLQKARDEASKNKPDDALIAVKIKYLPDAGKGMTRRDSQKEPTSIKFHFGTDKPDKEQKSTSSEETNYTEVVLTKTAKNPGKFLMHFDKATKSEDDKPENLVYQGRTIQFELKDGKYQWTAGKPVIDDKDKGFAALVKKVNDDLRVDTDELFIPARDVRVGEEWPIDNKLVKDAFASDADVDISSGTARAKLVKVYQKEGKKYGSIEIAIKATVKGVDIMSFNPPGILEVTGTLDAPIDGSSTAGTMSLSMKLTGKGQIVPKGETLVSVDLAIEQTTKIERSEELAATDTLVVQLQSDFTKGSSRGPRPHPRLGTTRKKVQKARQLAASAYPLLQAKRFVDADKVLMEAKQLAPNDPEVLKAIQEFFRAKAVEVAQLVTNAKTAIKGKRLPDAYTLLTQANALSPQDPDLLGAIQDYTKELVREAQAAIKGNRAAEAYTMLNQAYTIAPQDPDVQKAVHDYVLLLVRDAETAIKGKRLDEAKNLLTQANNLAPNDQAVVNAINQYKLANNQATAAQTAPQVKQLVSDARAAIRGKQFDVATAKLQTAAALDPQNQDVQTAIRELTTAMANAAAAATKVVLKANVQGPNQVLPGGFVQVQVTVDRTQQNSFQGDIALYVNNPPPGIVVQGGGQMGIPRGQNGTIIGFQVMPGTAPGNKQIGIQGQAVGAPNATTSNTTCTINVQKPPGGR